MDEVKNAVREMVEAQTGLRVVRVSQISFCEFIAECENGERFIVG